MVWLRNAAKDDYSLDLDVNQDQYQFVASYKNILDYAFYKKDKERTHAFIICDEEVAVGAVRFELHLAVLPGELGEQGSQQDQKDGEMQGANRHPFPYTTFHRHENCHQCP